MRLNSWIWGLWIVFTLAWTTALVSPTPTIEAGAIGEMIQQRRYLFAKSLHVGVYAVWTIASAWLPISIRYRLLIPAFLMAHGVLTENIQFATSAWTNRTGNIIDAGFDGLGVIIGLVVVWKRWTRLDGPANLG